MARGKGGYVARRRRNRVLKQAEGFWGKRKSNFRIAQEAVDRSLKYAFRDRRVRKREFRRLWVNRIGAAARLHGLSYSKLIGGRGKGGGGTSTLGPTLRAPESRGRGRAVPLVGGIFHLVDGAYDWVFRAILPGKATGR